MHLLTKTQFLLSAVLGPKVSPVVLSSSPVQWPSIVIIDTSVPFLLY